MRVVLGLGVVLAAVQMVGAGPSRVQAQSTENAEARAFFDQGNRAFERSQRVMGSARRQELLEEALAAYVSSLAIVRSKNALFNAGVTLAALGRAAEAYSYFGEYLELPGLTDEERRAGDEQRAGLVRNVMMVSVRSSPPGAEVRVDRPDLQALGRTPLVVALDPGEHVLLVRGADGADGAVTVVAVAGGASEVETVVEAEAESESEDGAGAGAESEAESGAAAGPSSGLRRGAWGTTAALGLGGLALRLRAGRVTRTHQRLEEEYERAPDPDLVSRAEVLYARIVRANRTSQALTALTLVGLGVSVGLSVRGRRVERTRLRVVVNGEVAGLSVGLEGALR